MTLEFRTKNIQIHRTNTWYLSSLKWLWWHSLFLSENVSLLATTVWARSNNHWLVLNNGQPSPSSAGTNTWLKSVTITIDRPNRSCTWSFHRHKYLNGHINGENSHSTLESAMNRCIELDHKCNAVKKIAEYYHLVSNHHSAPQSSSSGSEILYTRFQIILFNYIQSNIWKRNLLWTDHEISSKEQILGWSLIVPCGFIGVIITSTARLAMSHLFQHYPALKQDVMNLVLIALLSQLVLTAMIMCSFQVKVNPRHQKPVGKLGWKL